MVNHDPAILDRDGAVAAAHGPSAIHSHADIADDHVVRVLDDERGEGAGPAGMGDEYAAPWRRFSGKRNVRIADDRPKSGKTDHATHPKYADPRALGVDARTQRTRSGVGKRGHGTDSLPVAN